MKITAEHVLFWQQRRVALPAWAQSVAAHPVTVDQLIHDGASRRLDAHNLLSILRLARKRGALRETLQRIAQEPGTIINPKRRAGYAAKWLRRLERMR